MFDYAVMNQKIEDVRIARSRVGNIDLPDDVKNEAKARVAEKIDDLLGYLLQIPAPNSATAQAEVSEIFQLSSSNLQERFVDLPLEVVPVAVIRMLLLVDRIVFDPVLVPNWEVFSHRFQKLILDA